MEIEREEGEMSDSEMLTEDLVEPTLINEVKHTVLYKRDKNGFVVEQLEKVDASKIEERAKRFGVSLTGNRIITQKQIDELYQNFGIKDVNERHFRFDTLHLNGIDGLSTKEIFEYLEDYKPVAIEWIDDNSCNIVCQDHISVALALLLHSREINDDNLKDMLLKKSSYHWREGIPHSNTELILMRFATNSDKKVTKLKLETKNIKDFDKNVNLDTKNPWGDLCRSWGVYDHQEIFRRKLPQDDDDDDKADFSNKVQIRNKQLAMRLGKRNLKVKDHDDSSSDSDWKKKSKAPRMRMHADDEECKQKKPPIESSDEESSYAPLSIEVLNTQSAYTPRKTSKLSEKFESNARSANNTEKKSIQSRLGAKVVPVRDACSSDESMSDNSDFNMMSRVQKVNKNNPRNTASVWSRLDIKSNNQNEQNDLRQILKSKKQKKPDDLRSVISRTKQSNLRIEVDNNYVNK
ncbi:unnamed protein product [Parnassius mnemosyne]|uniref:Nuclear cap-binding protein subunit 3 n=1 Tax=Parnassius mnemosyne TaxID=213953 RepID=A0AAV1KJ03_9NEOP